MCNSELRVQNQPSPSKSHSRFTHFSCIFSGRVPCPVEELLLLQPRSDLRGHFQRLLPVLEEEDEGEGENERALSLHPNTAEAFAGGHAQAWEIVWCLWHAKLSIFWGKIN